jgi:hypothetical protein
MVEHFKAFYHSNTTTEEYETINAFAHQYDAFLESMFPKIRSQKSYMEQVLQIRLRAGTNINGMNIRTLDGCGLSWDITAMSSMNKGYWNPITNASETFTVNVPSSTKSAIRVMEDGYRRGLFPHVIHSIDAAVMRIVICRVWKRTNYVINQLHDCMLCNPNIAAIVYEVIEEIYTDGTLDNLADKVFFTPMQEGLSDDDIKRIQALRDAFYENGDTFSIVKGEFNARNAYTYEGSAKNKAIYIKLKEKGLKLVT